MAPIYTDFFQKREALVKKKQDFWVKTVQKVPKNAFFGLFFQKLESSENNFDRPKKKCRQNFQFFLKI